MHASLFAKQCGHMESEQDNVLFDGYRGGKMLVRLFALREELLSLTIDVKKIKTFCVMKGKCVSLPIYCNNSGPFL